MCLLVTLTMCIQCACLLLPKCLLKLTMCLFVTKSCTNERPLECLSLTVPQTSPCLSTMCPLKQGTCIHTPLDMLSNFNWRNQAQLKQPCSFYSAEHMMKVHTISGWLKLGRMLSVIIGSVSSMIHLAGKCNQGLMVTGSLKHLISDRQLAMEEESQALILWWCVEWVRVLHFMSWHIIILIVTTLCDRHYIYI